MPLDLHKVACSLWRDSFHLNELTGNRSVRSGLVGSVATKPALYLRIDFSEFSPNLEIPTRVLKMPFRTFDETVKNIGLLKYAIRVSISTLKRRPRRFLKDVVRGNAVKRSIDPGLVKLVPFPRRRPGACRVRDFFGAISPLTHLVKEVPVTHGIQFPSLQLSGGRLTNLKHRFLGTMPLLRHARDAMRSGGPIRSNGQ